MNIKRYIAATLALFAFFFFYEWFLHGVLLSPFYEETAAIWRPYAEMMANMSKAMIMQFLLAAWTAFVFTRFLQEDGCIKKGLLFGLYFGVFAGLLTATWYLWLPVPAKLGVSWFFGGLVEGLGAGLILGSIYQDDKKTSQVA
jgi:hypothetical protein